jgi:iron(III) transport system permease protein
MPPGSSRRTIRKPKRHNVRRSLPGRLTIGALLAIAAVLIVLPVGILLLGSFLIEPPRALHVDWSGLTLRNYAEVLFDRTFPALLGLSLGAACVGTAGALVIGTGLAWLAVRSDVPGRRILEASAVTPLFVSPLIGAFAWEILGSPQSGILNIMAREIHLPGLINVYTFGGICFVFAIYYAPYVFLFSAASLRNMDPVLEEAAAMCGASRLRSVLDVTLPLIAPALVSSALLVFVLLIELFSIPAVLGPGGNLNFLSVEIWNLIGVTPPKVNEASALGVVLLVITATLVLVQRRVLGGRSFVTVAGKGLRPTPVKLGGARLPCALAGFGYIAVAVVLPYAALVFIALRKSLYFSNVAAIVDSRQFGVGQFAQTLSDPVVQTALRNSMLVGAGTMIFGCLLYFAMAYVIQRTKLPGRTLLDAITTLPIAIPGLIIGLGFLWAWISLPIGIYGTLWIIILAYVAQFSPQGVRAIGASLIQIHPELEESSRVSGATMTATLRYIVMPLAWPGIFSALVLLFVLSFRELATALFLYTSNTIIFSVAMFDLWSRGSTSTVAVMALVQAAILLVFVAAGQAARRPPIDQPVKGMP